MTSEAQAEVADRVARLLGERPERLLPVTHRGYTPNHRWVLTLAGGGTAFVKMAIGEPWTDLLRNEHRIYAGVKASFVPRMLGWDDGEHPLLVIEDLSDAFWPPPWTSGGIEAVRRGLEHVASASPPAGVPSAEDAREELLGWPDVARDPGPFLSLRLCSAVWLEGALPVLLDAAASAVLEGDGLVHLDVRSDNICLREGQLLLVDWSYASRGNPLLDVASWLPSLHAEGGPPPEQMFPRKEAVAELAALLAGYWAARAGLPPPPTATARLRELQVQQLGVALPWAAQSLGLPPPA